MPIIIDTYGVGDKILELRKAVNKIPPPKKPELKEEEKKLWVDFLREIKFTRPHLHGVTECLIIPGEEEELPTTRFIKVTAPYSKSCGSVIYEENLDKLRKILSMFAETHIYRISEV